MGRRAKKAPVVTKKRPKLAKRFKCPFCANDDVVECKMDFKAGLGSLQCRLCGAAYQMPIHHLHEPIDVFSEWLDDCEAAQNPRSQQQQTAAASEGGVPRYQDEEDDNDDDIPESSGLGQKKQASTTASSGGQQGNYDLDVGDSEDDDDDDE